MFGIDYDVWWGYFFNLKSREIDLNGVGFKATLTHA